MQDILRFHPYVATSHDGNASPPRSVNVKIARVGDVQLGTKTCFLLAARRTRSTGTALKLPRSRLAVARRIPSADLGFFSSGSIHLEPSQSSDVAHFQLT